MNTPTNPNDAAQTASSSTTETDPAVLARLAKITAAARLPDPTLTAPPGTGTFPRSTLLGEFVAKLLGTIARVLSPELVEKSLQHARNIGQFAVLAGAGLTLIYAIFAAIKYNSFALFLTGIGILAALAVGQFAATRFLSAATQALEQTPSRISSAAFLECTGLLVLLLAAGTLIGGLITSIQIGSIVPFIPALLTSAALTFLGALALHPQTLNVETRNGSAGEEAIGLLSFFFKAGIKLVPLFFCLLAVAGCLAITASFFQAGQGFASMVSALAQVLPLPINAPYGLAASTVVLVACLLPIAAYFIFLIQYLVLDILRAILSVPGKLDLLRTRD